MGNNKHLNQIKIGVILSYVNTGMNMVIQLAYTPVMIRILGQSEYGLYSLVGSVVSYLGLFSLGFTGAYLRFYSRYAADKDEESIKKLNGFFMSLFLVMAAIAFTTGMILARFPEQIFGKNLTAIELRKAKLLMQILVVNIALTFPSSVLDSIISSKEQFIWQRIVNLCYTVFQPFICLPLLLLGYGSVSLVVVTTILTLLRFLVNLYYCKAKINAAFMFRGVEKSLVREISTFSFFIFLNMLIDQVNVSIDKYVLGRVSGTIAVAVYGIGSSINAMYMAFSTTISSVFAPRINLIAMEYERDKVKRNAEFTELFVKVGRIQYCILSLIIMGVVFFGRFFITKIYATSEYSVSYYVALLIMLPETIPLMQNIGLEIINSINYHYYRSIAYSLMSVVNIIISIPLARAYGPAGAAFGTTLSMIAVPGIFMNCFYAKIGIDIARFWKNIGRISLALLIPLICGGLLHRFVVINSKVTFGLLVLGFSTIHITSLYFFGMNEYEKSIVRGIGRKLRWRRKSNKGSLL